MHLLIILLRNRICHNELGDYQLNSDPTKRIIKDRKNHARL